MSTKCHCLVLSRAPPVLCPGSCHPSRLGSDSCSVSESVSASSRAATRLRTSGSRKDWAISATTSCPSSPQLVRCADGQNSRRRQCKNCKSWCAADESWCAADHDACLPPGRLGRLGLFLGQPYEPRREVRTGGIAVINDNVKPITNTGCRDWFTAQPVERKLCHNLVSA